MGGRHHPSTGGGGHSCNDPSGHRTERAYRPTSCQRRQHPLPGCEDACTAVSLYSSVYHHGSDHRGRGLWCADSLQRRSCARCRQSSVTRRPEHLRFAGALTLRRSHSRIPESQPLGITQSESLSPSEGVGGSSPSIRRLHRSLLVGRPPLRHVRHHGAHLRASRCRPRIAGQVYAVHPEILRGSEADGCQWCADG